MYFPFSLLTLLIWNSPVLATPTVRPTDIAPVAYQICAEVALELQNAVELGYLTQDAANHVNANCLSSDFSDYNM
jgi:hypothetical protein